MTDTIRRPKARFKLVAIGCSALLTAAFPFICTSATAQVAESPEPASLSYARMAELVSSSPTVARITVRSIVALKRERAPDLPETRSRFYVQAETLGLIRSDGVMSKRISFLVDGSAENARRPNLKNKIFLAFGKVGQQVSEFQLSASTALVPWTPANEALARKVIEDLYAPGAPGPITAITSAFHVPGAIVGEGETQIFLGTADGSPISLSVIRRPQEQPHFSVSLGEVVDDSAKLPERDTLLWYRLACSLPDQLPALSLTELARNDAEAASRDYNAFRAALGPCDRTQTPVI